MPTYLIMHYSCFGTYNLLLITYPNSDLITNLTTVNSIGSNCSDAFIVSYK